MMKDPVSKALFCLAGSVFVLSATSCSALQLTSDKPAEPAPAVVAAEQKKTAQTVQTVTRPSAPAGTVRNNSIPVDKIDETLAVKAKLDSFAYEHAVRSNHTLVPNRYKMEIFRRGTQYVARYQEVDVDTLRTEIYLGTTKSTPYVGHIIYVEKTCEAIGRSAALARAGQFKVVKARRTREVSRYDAKKGWVY
ncbi:MAG: hypothetical protein PUB69_03560 [Desulfovibrionaceae bacterium]|nr:hypothetical protein [Desulfovibrionaceae bacterium]